MIIYTAGATPYLTQEWKIPCFDFSQFEVKTHKFTYQSKGSKSCCQKTALNVQFTLFFMDHVKNYIYYHSSWTTAHIYTY
jgi:hypothetical protein